MLRCFLETQPSTLRKPEVVPLSGLSWLFKENESPVWCGRTELASEFECKQVIGVQSSFFINTVFDLRQERVRE